MLRWNYKRLQCPKHSDTCGRFLDSILSNANHHFQSSISKTFHYSSTRSTFRLIRFLITTPRNSPIPYVVRLRVNYEMVTSDLRTSLKL